MSSEPRTGSDSFRQALAPLVDRMRALVTAVDDTRTRHGDVASVESPAMREIADEERYATVTGWATPIRDAHTFGGMTLFAAADYVCTFADTFTVDKPPVYGHLVLARAALESAAVSWWLSQDGIERDERVKRGLSEHLYSDVEKERAGIPDAADHVDEWIDRAGRLGWRVTERGGRRWRHGSHGEPRVDGVSRPSPSATITRLLVRDETAQIGRLQWSRLSAVMHVTWFGIEWALHGEDALPGTTGDTATVPIGTNSRSVGIQALCILRCLREAASARFALMGWRDNAWRAVATATELYKLEMMRALSEAHADDVTDGGP